MADVRYRGGRPAGGPEDPDDETLLSWLRDLFAIIDPEPEHLQAFGRAALSIRRVDDELAELVADSRNQAALVRSAGDGPRLLTFALGAVSLELQVSDRGGRLDALGIVDGLGPAGGRVDLESASGAVVATAVDDLGRYSFEGMPRGLVRLRVVGAAVDVAVDVTTDWVNLTA